MKIEECKIGMNVKAKTEISNLEFKGKITAVYKGVPWPVQVLIEAPGYSKSNRYDPAELDPC